MVMAVLLTRKYSQAERRKQLLKLEIETKMVELEMQALQAQMNPHFIFNCVSGIQYFILANKKKEVMDYLSDFSKVVRESLTNATLRMIPLAQETEFLHSYLRLEQMRFPDKFDYEISCLDRLEVGFVQLPPMLVQPFAENTIRHGFTNLERKGYLTIVFETAGTELLKCTVTDNGNGRCKMEVQKEPSSQRERLHSTSITETRIRLFNLPGSDEKYKIIYTDLCENSMPCGLKVELYLPMEKASIEAQ